MSRHSPLFVRLALASALSAGATLAAAQGTLDVSSLGLGALEGQIAEREGRLAAQRAQKSAFDAALATLPERQRQLEQALSRDVRVLYRLRRGGLLPIAHGLQGLMRHASRLAHLERMALRTLRQLEGARQENARLSREARELETATLAVEQELLSFERARAELLEREALAKQQLSEEPYQIQQPSSDGRISYGLSLVGTGGGVPSQSATLDESSRFSAQRGTLALPVSGVTSLRHKTRADGAGEGIELTTELGASVRAVADGKVASVERDAEGNLLVVVAHGTRYRTLYAGLQTVEVEPGDAISKSARIGAAGGAPVYFEVRRGAQSQDARAWLGRR